ncbi:MULTISPECIES: zf-TFIIB domain-containing protein [Streptomyces]|uniref:Zf-TFIIB domain-containing protein n=1 Tax=Streptomyces glycanivorans TaxID=3033808 RepID=A0ABY9JKP0_9ACTN|nr:MULTISPECIES: zf-TFIIB domain-containing protein [unclassified Streptomyces]WSQ81031.1 zf-TFIIB domain-containing protein [Streptomyces sp. NBC_01213]WLQ67690.1 zf-TFIIB domain-containing protein [Streptomyces sp. Alt3]WSQ88361.1 zf-TFIIB domain-containing protein [Streptomyces sp. NBC_01212]WSR05631.1 zf-TFIIB domain-containing protein [Streptomyces sp. NBC_01208]WSR51757.1 zf-TFIIB domain-containing protein [Streptomyces sp. NBC_01201]
MIQCPKCHAQMNTYNRNGVQIEQCSGCRGIFLDYGELESLTRLESQWAQQAPPAPPAPQQPYPAQQAYPAAPAPAWGAPHQGGHYGGHHRQKSFGRMLFSS